MGMCNQLYEKLPHVEYSIPTSSRARQTEILLQAPSKRDVLSSLMKSSSSDSSGFFYKDHLNTNEEALSSIKVHARDVYGISNWTKGLWIIEF